MKWAPKVPHHTSRNWCRQPAILGNSRGFPRNESEFAFDLRAEMKLLAGDAECKMQNPECKMQNAKWIS